MNTAKSFTPQALVKSTTAILVDPGIAYNQAAVTYNQAGEQYGGFSGNSDIFTGKNTAKDIHP